MFKSVSKIIVAFVAVLAMVSGSPQFGFNGGFGDNGMIGFGTTCFNGVCSSSVCSNGICNDDGSGGNGRNIGNRMSMQQDMNGIAPFTAFQFPLSRTPDATFGSQSGPDGGHFFNGNSFSHNPFASNGMNGFSSSVGKTCVNGVCTESVCVNGICNEGSEGNGASVRHGGSGASVRNGGNGGFVQQDMSGGHFFHGYPLPGNRFASNGNFQESGNSIGRPVNSYANQHEFDSQDIYMEPDKTCDPSITIVNNNHPCADTIIFEDDFNFINESKWSKLREFGGDPDNEFVVYIPNEDVLYTQDGSLHIQPKRLETEYGENAELRSLDLGLKCTSEDGPRSDYCTRTSGSTIIPPVISSRITTLNKFSFIYGKVQIRAKLPSEDWVFPLLLLEPANNFYGKRNLASGQMRIAFVKGKDGLLSGGVLLGATEPTRTIKMCTNPNPINLSSDFHTFSLDWRPDEITLSIENQIYCRIDPQRGFYTHFLSNGNIVNNVASLWRNEGKMAPFDKEFRLTIGIGVGGLNDFIDYGDSVRVTPRKPWKNTQVKAMKLFWDAMKNRSDYPGRKSGLEIDYVRVYSL